MSRPSMVSSATQGHRYRIRFGVFAGREAICIEGGDSPRVSIIDGRKPYPLGLGILISASNLEPLPMRYFHGEIPR